MIFVVPGDRRMVIGVVSVSMMDGSRIRCGVGIGVQIRSHTLRFRLRGRIPELSRGNVGNQSVRRFLKSDQFRSRLFIHFRTRFDVGRCIIIRPVRCRECRHAFETIRFVSVLLVGFFVSPWGCSKLLIRTASVLPEILNLVRDRGRCPVRHGRIESCGFSFHVMSMSVVGGSGQG